MGWRLQMTVKLSQQEEMRMALPNLDREAYQDQMRAEFERVLQEVAGAVDNAPQGRVIRDSEEKARDALDRFRRIAYERAIQMKVNAAEAAFPPSEQRDDGEEETAQGKAIHQRADRQRAD